MSAPTPRERPARLFAAALAAFFLCTGAYAQSFPAGPVRIVPPYPPGGGTDILARAIAAKLTERHGIAAIVDNRAGANGTIGAAFVAKAPADGHTMLVVPAGYAANPALYRNLPYDQNRDLVPASHLASGPLVLVVHPSLPAKSIRELVALAKSQPGAINCGSAGNGSLPHLSLELFNTLAGAKITHIPYKGSGAAIADVLGGQVPVYFMNILQSLPLIKANRLRALGVTSPSRSPIAPNVPAIAEAGLPEFDMTNWYGLLLPSATPRETVVRVQQEVSRILNLPELRQRLGEDGMTVVASTPDAFTQFLKRETAKYGRVIEAAGIKGSL
jgi:tripartite-type tricarboxylate transporter receptor subunit TctC